MLTVRPDGAADVAPQADRTRDGKTEADGGRYWEGPPCPPDADKGMEGKPADGCRRAAVVAALLSKVSKSACGLT